MATEVKVIKVRRGAYTDFDKTKMNAGEPAVTTSGDPNALDGKGVYMGVGPGQVKQVAMIEDIEDILNNAVDGAVDEATQQAEAEADRAEAAATQLASTVTQVTTNTANIAQLNERLADIKTILDNIDPLSDEVKVTLLACFEHVAWIDDHGIDYYNALENALYPLASINVVYTQSGQVYATDLLDSLKSDLVVTAINPDSSQYIVPASEYTLSGTLVVGTSTITVTYKNKTATFTVNVTDLRLVYEINPDTDLTGRAIDTGVPVFGKNANFTILVNTDLAIVQSNKTMAYLLNHKTMSNGTIRLGFDNNNNLLHFITNVMYSDYYAEYYTPGDISPSVTHNVVWIVRMDNQYVRKILYVDNNKLVDRSENVSSYVKDREFTGNYLVGGNLNTTNLNYTWPGSVNLFRIYNEALDISEIESIMNLTL